MDAERAIVTGIFTNILYALFVSLCALIYRRLRKGPVHTGMILLGTFPVFLCTFPAFYVAFLWWQGNPAARFMEGIRYALLSLIVVGYIALGYAQKKPEESPVVHMLTPLTVGSALSFVLFFSIIVIVVFVWLFSVLREMLS